MCELWPKFVLWAYFKGLIEGLTSCNSDLCSNVYSHSYISEINHTHTGKSVPGA